MPTKENYPEFGNYLKSHGLKHDKWLSEFAKNDIASEDNILSIKSSGTAAEMIESFKSVATEEEIIILNDILGISTESQVPQNPGIDSCLDSVGLDTKYWSKVFSAELGISSAEALKFVGSESYPILESHVHHQWEKKALRELLVLKKKDNLLKNQRKLQKEMIEQRLYKARQLLQQLKDFRDEGKSRNDKQVEQTEFQVREMLQIHPDRWITKTDSLNDLIIQLEARDKKISGELHSRAEVDDSIILKSASGGLALTGILLTRKVEDQLKDRNCLLQVPQTVTLLGPAHCQNKWIKEFSSKAKEDLYIRSVNKLGYSVSASAQAGFWSFQLEVSTGYANQSKMDTTRETHKVINNYCSTVKHSSMPLASYCFSDRDLILSEDAHSALKMIDTKITKFGQENVKVKQACEEFFKRFGSHANRGPLHFGGVYWLKCSSSGIKESEMALVKQLQIEAVSTDIGFSYSGVGVSNISRIKARYTGNCCESTISQTQLEILQTGGPPEHSTLTDWKTGLVSSNSTWSVIDRGTMLVPVWDIISNNHSTELSQVSTLVYVLQKAWETIAELKTLISSLTPSSEMAQVVEVVSEWNKSSSTMSQKDIQECVNDLIKVKQVLIKGTTNPQAWSLLYLKQPQIQQFLKNVLDAQNVSPLPPEAAHVKQLMQQLLEKSDLVMPEFPLRHEFLQWLYDEGRQHQQKATAYQNCHDIISLGRYLDLVIEKLKDIQQEKSSYNDPIPRFCDSETSAAVASVIKSLLKTLRTSSTYEFILLSTLIYPFIYDYGCDEFIMLKSLSLGDIEFLSKALTAQRKDFYKISTPKDNVRIQAHLFYLAIDMYCNEQDVDVSELQLQKHLEFMQQVLGDQLHHQLKDILSNCLIDGTEWRNILSNLSLYASSANQKQVRLQSSHSLDYVLQTVPKTPKKPTFKRTEVNVHEVNLAVTDGIKLGKIRHFFDALDLTKYYPRKLTLQLALCIRQNTLGDCTCSNPTELPLFILQKIMAYDYRCRSELYKGPNDDTNDDTDSDDSELYKGPNDDTNDDTDSDDSSDIEESFFPAINYIHVDDHPLDCLLAVLHCADDFLRQDLMARLVTCQLAIPFLLPDPFTRKLTLPLWAMKTIVKEWKCTLSGREGVYEGPIINYKAPIISFIRMSRQSKSKSNTMNIMISDSNHEHFFHRNMEGGLHNRLLGDGLVDVCWYLPSGKQRDIFPDAIMFLNLHGDARAHQQQVKFLSQISFLTFAFVSEEDFSTDNFEESEHEMLSCDTVLSTLSKSHCGLVLLTDKVNKGGKLDATQKRLPVNVWVITMEDKNDDKIKKRIRERINKIMCEMWKQMETKMLAIDSERCVELAHNSGITTDEDSQEFIEGRNLACSLKTILTSHKARSPSAKQAMLPLQGKSLWIKWASLDKEEHRQVNRGGEKLDKYGLRKLAEKRQVRRMQLHHVQKPTLLMESFIASLLKTSEYPIVRNYFLQCVKLILNNRSREEISQLHILYNEKRRSRLLQLQTKKEVNQEAVKQCKLEIEELHEQMINASLGLEHLLRELGQVYEAIQESNVSGPEAEQLSRLPQAAASLLIDGYPLEIMDGDAAHVPIKWINAVLNEVKRMLKDPHVFILSVLGLQSTGKSTLMNTAFGLQFNVSAGRCTRGAFMQLLPISEELHKDVKCKYILVIDTEGLRAPELDSQKTQTHDNELATFVIGLADVTLINIFGESPGDMDDILQTAVHAFIRMASVDLNPSCQFVHQNVGAVLASGKGDMGRSRFKDKLDAMTCAAAKEENCEGKYECFSEVIQFDGQKDVHHFPGLWKGDPPMATVNTEYSEKAQSLVAHLIDLIKDRNLKFSNQVSTFQTRVVKLWKALLNESFVFSFKNTMERTAYSSLEAQYIHWSWSFKHQMLEWQKTAESKIKLTRNRDELTSLQRSLLKDLPDFVHKVHDEILINLTEFFKESKQREMLAQWQSDAQNRLKRLAQDEEDSGIDLCMQLTAAQMARAEVGDLNKAYSDKMFLKLEEVFVSVETDIKQRIAERMKTLSSGDDHEAGKKIEKEIKEQELYDTFDSLWKVWIEEMVQTLPRHHYNTDVERDAEKALTETYRRHATLIISELKAKPLHQWGKELKLPIVSSHIVLKKKTNRAMERLKAYDWGKSQPTEHHIKQVEHITTDIFGKAKQFLEDKRNENYRAIHFTDLLHLLLKAIDNHTSEEYCEVTLTQEYRIAMSLTVCGFAVKQFEQKVEATRKQNDPIAYLEQELRKPLYDMFRSKYDHTCQDKAAASIFCRILYQKIKKQIESSMGRVIVEDIVVNNPCLKTKPGLIKKILIELGEQVQSTGCLDDYYVYLKDPDRSIKHWIKRFTYEHCEKKGADNQSKLVFLARLHLESLVTFIAKCVQKVERKYRQSNGTLDLNTWLKDFCTSLEGQLQLDFDVFDTLTREFEALNDIKRFTEEVLGGLSKLHLDLRCTTEKYTTCDLEKWRNRPDTILYGQLRGCPECCPFCGEQCKLLMPGHQVEHNIIFHRPNCLIGYRDDLTSVLTADICTTLVGSGKCFRNKDTDRKFHPYNELSADICTTLVGSEKSFRNKDTDRKFHPYKEYTKLYPKWEIICDRSMEASSYWKWFLGNYGNEMAEYYGAKANGIFREWKKHFMWEEAKQEVENMN